MSRLLVVEDQKKLLNSLKCGLEEEGYEVVLSGFPIQQISDVEQIHPDLIILDFVFGDKKSGWQMLQMLKMKRSTASIPVIVCTAALDMVREQEGYLVSQGIHVVFKPFDIDHLLTNVKQLLTHEHASSISKEEGKKK